MKITILNGADEIGGSKILVEHEKTRILVDFGRSFKRTGEFFSEFLKPRKAVALADFFEFGLLPDMQGLYRPDYLEHMGRPKDEPRLVDAVLISHAHLDHAEFITFLRADIPIYCSTATKLMLASMAATGSGIFDDYIELVLTYQFRPEKKKGKNKKAAEEPDAETDTDAGSGAAGKQKARKLVCMKAGDENSMVKRDYIAVDAPANTFTIGSLEITAFPVDHSMPGAVGFIIKGGDKVVAYTGDLRFHGSRPALTRDFVTACKAATPDLLLTEGTRVDEGPCDSEAQVEAKINTLLKNARGLVCVEYGYKDLDRARSILNAATGNNRRFVINMKMAHLIKTLGALSPVSLDEVDILVPKKSWGLIGSTTVEHRLVEQDYDGWERAYAFLSNSITASKIAEHPEKYMVSMTMWNVNQLVDIQPNGGLWIKSSTEPFSDEMELDEDRKKRWLAHFKLEIASAHASGHVSGPELFDMIKTIGPKLVVPVHTENPRAFDKEKSKFGGIPVKLLANGQAFEL